MQDRKMGKFRESAIRTSSSHGSDLVPLTKEILHVTANIIKERRRRLLTGTLLAAASIAALSSSAEAQGIDLGLFPGNLFVPGNLVVTRSVYTNGNNITAGVTNLPPGCTPVTTANPSPADPCAAAAVSSAYPYVFNNDTVDGSFGITSKIYLDQITPFGFVLTSLEVPNSSQSGVTANSDQMVTSFSSKSELALNLSVDGKTLTFLGYEAPVSAIDVSNSNTPGEADPTNPIGPAYYRTVGQIDTLGNFQFTKTNAFTGDNGRAAILNDNSGANVLYMAGNAGNGTAKVQPAGTILSTGAQITTPANQPESAQTPGAPTAVGSFNITQLGDKIDKVGKDTNFRGMTVYDNVLYYAKGSGSNGVNTVYFVDPTGTVCTDSNGVGLPAANAKLPTSPLMLASTNPATIQANGLQPDNMCILKGFPTTLAKTPTAYPFGVWFASSTVMYVADEGNGNTGTTAADFYTAATPAQNPTAGLQKWIFNGTEWQLAYTLTNGLDLGVPYTVPGYPTGLNNGTAGTGFPWAPATAGLRNITGIVNFDGTATIYAITSTISGSGDQGTDPNKLVAITDKISATTLPSSESFLTVHSAASGEVLRGVAFAPGTPKVF